MRDVEMLDVEPLTGAPRTGPPVTLLSLDGEPASDPIGHHAPQHRATGRRRRRLVVLLVVGALVAGGALVADRLGGTERVAAIAPGMLARIDQPPWQRWRAPVDTGDVVVPVGDVLVVTAVRMGRFTVTGLDAADGSSRWVQDLGPVAGARPLTGCRAADGATGEGAAMTIPEAEPAQAAGTVLLCVVEGPRTLERRGASVVGAPGTGDWPTSDLLVAAIAADTGEEVGRWHHRGRVLDVARVGDDLVLLSADHLGVPRVERRSGAAGEVRWWHEDEKPLRLRSGAAARPQLRVNETFVLVQSWSVSVLSAEDGDDLLTSTPGDVVVGALDGELVSTWTPFGGVVRDGEGDEVFRTPVLFPPLVVSDAGSADVVVLDEGGTVVARSLPGGEELWRLDTYRSVRVVAAGVVVLLGVDGYSVVDLATGVERWSLPGRELMWWAPLTDGSLVLAPGRTASGDATVEARRLSDGEVAWTVPLEPGTRTVSAEGGHLLLRTRDQVISLS
jgi:hypothetical protein